MNALKCKSCGAPLSKGGCSYCGSQYELSSKARRQLERALPKRYLGWDEFPPMTERDSYQWCYRLSDVKRWADEGRFEVDDCDMMLAELGEPCAFFGKAIDAGA